jgi:hypothetical protein
MNKYDDSINELLRREWKFVQIHNNSTKERIINNWISNRNIENIYKIIVPYVNNIITIDGNPYNDFIIKIKKEIQILFECTVPDYILLVDNKKFVILLSDYSSNELNKSEFRFDLLSKNKEISYFIVKEVIKQQSSIIIE